MTDAKQVIEHIEFVLKSVRDRTARVSSSFQAPFANGFGIAVIDQVDLETLVEAYRKLEYSLSEFELGL